MSFAGVDVYANADSECQAVGAMVRAGARGSHGAFRGEAEAHAGARAAHYSDGYGNHRGELDVGAGAHAKGDVGLHDCPLKVVQAGAKADVYAGAKAEGLAGLGGQKGDAFAGAEANAEAHLGGVAHAGADAKAGAWANGINGVVYDPKSKKIHAGFGGAAGAGAQASVHARLGNEKHGLKLTPQVGAAEAKFEPVVTVDTEEESVQLTVGLGAALGVGADVEAATTVFNPINKETREGIARGDAKHVLRMNPNSVAVRAMMGEPKNAGEEVVQHIPVAGQAMAFGRKLGFW